MTQPPARIAFLSSSTLGMREGVYAYSTFCSLQDAVQAARINIALHLKPPFIGNRVAVENLILNYHTGAAAAEKAVCLYLRADLRQVAVHAARIDKYKMASASGFLKASFALSGPAASFRRRVPSMSK